MDLTKRTGCPVLETPRLLLSPLSLEEMDLLIEDQAALDVRLGLAPSAEEIDADLLDALREMRDGVFSHPDDWLWYANWMVVLREEERIVADFCFKGAPDERGEVEIGYGTAPAWRGRGLIAEALARAAEWAFGDPRMRVLVAETEPDNLPSHRVLEKIGMRRDGEREGLLRWILPHSS